MPVPNFASVYRIFGCLVSLCKCVVLQQLLITKRWISNIAVTRWELDVAPIMHARDCGVLE